VSTIRGQFKTAPGGFSLDLAFTIPNGGVTGVFGHSGSGKTTLLRCVAGLTRARDAELVIGDEIWQDEKRDIFMPVHSRGVGYVFQEASLFPHLSVRDNILYGFNRLSPRQRTITVDQAIAWTGLAPLLDRMPAGLSGGERQRVALARALLRSPKLLLMDEPLAALDEPGRAELMPYLDRLHRDLAVPMIYVSHSLRELARLADTLLLLREGRLVACGPLQEILPRVYTDSGITHEEVFSVLDATVVSHDGAYHLSELQTAFGTVWASKISAQPGESVRLQIAGRDVSIGLARDTQSSIVNQFPVRVAGIADRPPGSVVLELRPATGDDQNLLLSVITRRSRDHLSLETGAHAYARVKGVSILR